MPYPYTLMPDGHTLEPEDVVKPPAETQEESTSTQSPFLDFGNPPLPQTGAPTLDPVTGPPAFDSGPSPHLTQEATSHAQPPSTDEEVDRRKQRKERARQRFENAKQSSRPIADIPDFADLGSVWRRATARVCNGRMAGPRCPDPGPRNANRSSAER